METEKEFLKTFGLGVLASILAVAVIGWAFYAAWQATPGTSGYARAQESARAAVAGWPAAPRLTAELMIERYGAPGYRTADSMLWGRSGPWKRLAVHNTPDWDVLEQAVDYELTSVEAQKVDAIGQGLKADPGRDEIVANSESESLNFLAANVANDVVMGRRTPEEGRAFYTKTAELAASGKASPYMKGLLFTPTPPAPHRMYGRGMVY